MVKALREAMADGILETVMRKDGGINEPAERSLRGRHGFRFVVFVDRRPKAVIRM